MPVGTCEGEFPNYGRAIRAFTWMFLKIYFLALHQKQRFLQSDWIYYSIGDGIYTYIQWCIQTGLYCLWEPIVEFSSVLQASR